MENILSGTSLQPGFWNPLNQSLGNYILEYIRKNEDRVYMINGKTEQQLRLSEFAEKSTNLAINLQSLGCKPGTFAAIYSENSIEFAIAQLAILLSGATTATFNYLYTLEELHHPITLVQPKILFCSYQNYLKAKETQKNHSFIQHLIILDSPSSKSPDPNTLLHSNLVQKSPKKLIEPPYNPDATAVILFSSGTTGLPKGVMQTHRNMLYILHMIKVYDIFHFEGKFALSTVPMYHGYGMFVNLFTITLGQTLVFLSRYEDELYLSLIEKYKIKSLYLVPPMVVFLIKTDLVNKYDLSSVKHIVCGSAPLKISIENEIMEKLKLERVQQGYGMTETTLVVLQKLFGNQKPGTCGSVLPGTVAKVVDIETNKTVGPGQVGELCFKGPGVMKGYLRNPEATSNTILDGWLHSGDLGYYDKDGDFYIVDRLKELIKYKAYQVAPAELEDILIKHPQVKDAGVIGIPDETAGELPKAFVVKRRGSTITEKELQKYVAGKLSPQKWLRGGVTFIDEIPKNPSGKILRRKLRELTAKEVASKY